VDVDPDAILGEAVDGFVKGRDLRFGELGILFDAGVEGADLLEGQPDDFAGAVGGAVDGQVVHDDELAGGAALDVHLDHGGALVGGGLEGRDGVGGEGGVVALAGADAAVRHLGKETYRREKTED